MEIEPVKIKLKTGTNWNREPGFIGKDESAFEQKKQTSGLSTGSDNKEDAQKKESRLVKILDGSFSFCLALLFLGLPIFFTTMTFQGIAFEKVLYFYLFVLLMLVIWVTKSVVLGEMKIRRTPLDVPILIVAAAYIISAIFSVDRWHSFWGFFGDPSRGILTMGALLVGYILITSNFNEKRLWYSIYSIVFSNALLVIWMTVVLLGIKFVPEAIAVKLPLNPFGSIAGASIFFGMMIPVLMIAVFHSASVDVKNRIRKNVIPVIFVLILLLNIFLLSMLYSFVPRIAVLVGVGFFLIYVLAQLVQLEKKWSWLPLFVFVAILSIILIGKTSLVRVQLPIEATPNFALSWQVTKNALVENLLTGSGPATFGYDFSRFKPQEFNLNPLYNLRFYQGSGLMFEFFATLGILGGLSFSLLIVTFVSVVVYLLSKQKQFNKINSLGLVAASFMFLVAAMTSQVEGIILILGALVCSLAIATITLESRSQENCINLSLKASPKYALSLAFVFMIVSAGVVFMVVFLGKSFMADTYAGKAVQSKNVNEEGSIEDMTKAIQMFGYEGRYYTRLAQDYMVLANNEFLKEEKDRNAEALKQYLTNSIVAAKAGVEKMPNDVLSQEVLAQVYENATFYIPQSAVLARESYERALELEPHSAQFLVKLGQIKEVDVSAKQGDEQKQLLNEVKELFEKAIAEKKDYAPAHYQLALAREALGDLDGAIVDISNAVMIDGSNVNAVYNLGRLHQRRGKDEDLAVAKQVYDKILEANTGDINTRLSLGLLYEKQNKMNEAIEEYNFILTNLPTNTGDEVRTKLQKMISNAQAGIENNSTNIETSEISQ
ncbi:MAG: TPR protein [uncultured bacterium]|nr:MAG: TPR protein [uncultured bacterium]